MALISYMSRIQFDEGALCQLPEELALLDVSRPMLATDPGLVRAGVVERVLSLLPADTAVFDETPGNPTEPAILAALELYRQNGCDGVVAVGGGSPIDLAKCVALLATHCEPLGNYGILNGGLDKIGRIAPVLAIPTTAGTGAEVGRAATITLATGEKIACVSLNLIPKSVICDPELTYTLPPDMTAATGMDALSHGIEAYLSTSINPPADAIALDCVDRASTYLVRAFEDGADKEARREMLMAALEGGLCLQKSLGAVHAATHPLGALGLHHGTLNAVVLPAVLRFNAGRIRDKAERLRAAAGLTPESDLAEWIESLNSRLGMPPGLRAMGVTDGQLDALAEKAARDHLSRTNPRPASAADYRRILQESM
jgi:4-hydroxybutyrate dehydrogenase